MKNFKIQIIFALIILLITSCSTSSSVVSNSFLQKRKYNKGFHFTKKNKRATNKVKSNKQVDSLIVFNKVIESNKQEVLIKERKHIVLPSLKREKAVVEKTSPKSLVSKTRKLKAPAIFSLTSSTSLIEKAKVNLIFNKKLKSNVSVSSGSYDSSDNIDEDAILITIGVLLLLALLIAIIGWAAFFALLGKILLYILIAILYLIIVVGLIIVSAGLVLLLGDTFLSAIMDGMIDTML